MSPPPGPPPLPPRKPPRPPPKPGTVDRATDGGPPRDAGRTDGSGAFPPDPGAAPGRDPDPPLAGGLGLGADGADWPDLGRTPAPPPGQAPPATPEVDDPTGREPIDRAPPPGHPVEAANPPEVPGRGPGIVARATATAAGVRTKVTAARDAIAAVDWKAKAIATAQLLALLGVLAVHGYSTWGNFQAATQMKWICLGTAAIALLCSYFLWRWFGGGQAAVFALSLLITPVTVAAIWYGGPDERGFELAGRPTGFWASLACLGTVATILAWVWLRQISAILKYVFSALLLYCSLGFVVGLFYGATLDQVVLGVGPLTVIPFVAQPASIYLNVVLPLGLLGVGVMGTLALLRGEFEVLPTHAGAGVFLLLPLIMGIALMNRYLIPNLSFLLIGKPVHAGRVVTTYASTWDRRDTGASTHEIEITTRGYREGAATDYEMIASVMPASAPGELTRLTLTVKDKRRGNDVLNLAAADLVVKENGELQNHRLTAMLDRKGLETYVVLVLDHSGSMAGAMDELKAAATRFVTRLSGNVKVEVLAFSSAIQPMTQGFTNQTSSLTDAIAAIPSGGGTRLYDAVIAAQDELMKVFEGRKVIIVFTDGEDSGSHTPQAACYDRIRTGGVQVFSIGLGDDLVKSGGDKVMMKMSELSGAKYFFAKDAKELETAFASVLDYISCQYTLVYEKPLPPPPVVKLTSPVAGAELSGRFGIRAEVKGRAEQVEFRLDGIPVRTIQESREGVFEHPGEDAEQHAPGRHYITVVATDRLGRTATDRIEVTVKRALPTVTILEPAEGATIWQDARYRAKVVGQGWKQAVLLVDEMPIATFKPEDGPEIEQPLTVKTIKPGIHACKVRAEMPDGRKSEAMVGFKTLVPKPTVKLVAPQPNQQVWDKISVVAAADSGWFDTRITAVELTACGETIKLPGQGPFEARFNAAVAPAGPTEIRAVATNEVGESAEARITVEVIKPRFSIAIDGVADGQVLRAAVTARVLVVNEQPGTTIDRIEVQLDGQKVPLGGAPWQFPLEVLKMKPGEHELEATATRSDGTTFATRVRFITSPPRRVAVFCSVRDGRGRYLPTPVVKGLPLTVTEDGKPVRDLLIESAADLPVAFGLVIDVSGSMAEQRKLEKAKVAASVFIDLMKSNDRAFIVRFSEVAEVMQKLTADRTRLQQQIEYLVPISCTALYDGIQLGIDTMAGVKDRAALVVLSDGIDQNKTGTGPGSQRTLREVTEAARRQDLQLFAIGLGRELRDHGSLGEKVLSSLAAQTGGSYFFAASGGELEPRFREIMQQVGAQSKISFTPPSGANDGAWHRIEIKVPGRNDLHFIYKPSYLAP